jgi:hypothetical protein
VQESTALGLTVAFVKVRVVAGRSRTTESQAMSPTDGQKTAVSKFTHTEMDGDCAVALRDHFRNGPWRHVWVQSQSSLICVCGVAFTGPLIDTDCCMLNGLNKST